MQDTPGEERYDSYEPQNYSLIKIDDEYIENILEVFKDIPCYWHTLCRPETNLAYCGITLIPPQSTSRFISAFKYHDKGQFKEIIALFEEAERKNKYIIHYGL